MFDDCPLLQDNRNALDWASTHGFTDIVSALLPYNNANGQDAQLSLAALHLASANGHNAVVQVLLTSPNIDVNIRDSGGSTPLHWASDNNHVSTVQILLGAGADINMEDIVSITLCSLDPSCSANTWLQNGRTALSQASELGRVDVVRALLDRNLNVNSVTNESRVRSFFVLVMSICHSH